MKWYAEVSSLRGRSATGIWILWQHGVMCRQRFLDGKVLNEGGA